MTAQLLAAPYSYFADANGAPLNGGFVYTYIAGTTTPQASYTDSTAITPLANPVPLDSAGRAQIWLQGAYKIIVKDALGNTISTTDNITSTTATGNMNTAVYDPANIAQQVVGLTAVQTVTNKTFTNPTITTSNVTPVAGSMRNLVGSAQTSTTYSITADEITVETALAATSYKIANFSNVLNIAITGANGMDTGSAPTSGALYIYAIYNPANATSALLGTTTSSGATIYAGANLPVGYTATALVSVIITNGSAQLGGYNQFDRAIYFAKRNSGLTVGNQTSYTAVTLTSAMVPPLAKTISGIMGSSVSGANPTLAIAADNAGTAEQIFQATAGTVVCDNFYAAGSFTNLILATPQTFYYKLFTAASQARVDINSYTF